VEVNPEAVLRRRHAGRDRNSVGSSSPLLKLFTSSYIKYHTHSPHTPAEHQLQTHSFDHHHRLATWTGCYHNSESTIRALSHSALSKNNNMLSISTLLPLLVASTTLVAAFDVSSSRNHSVYQVVTDRFALADGSSPSCSPAAREYCGGSWKGIQNKLSYIQGMGFDTVWISPVVQNIGGTTGEGQAYHGQ
jgi:hypothetical protein